MVFYIILEVNMILPKQQVNSASKILVGALCFLQRFLKFPDVGVFHSYPELLHAALLESDPDVISFVPQPYKIMVNGRRYIPDCYVAYKDRHEVIELKPRGEFEDAKRIPITEYFKEKAGAEFKVISNESVMEQEIKAKNWLFIIQTLCNVNGLPTSNQEDEILEKFDDKPKQVIGDIVQLGNRINHGFHELALYRLIQQGKLDISHNKLIDIDTEVFSCI